MNIDVTTLRFASLVLAVLIYGVAGSPTPDHPGWVEGIIAVLLVCGSVPALPRVFLKYEPGNPWRCAAQLLLFLGLTVPLVIGVAQGHPPRLILRDMIPFLFMILPLFYIDIFAKKPAFAQHFLTAFIAAGLLFSARGAFEHIPFFAALFQDKELYYLANAPSVLFAALFLSGNGIRRYMSAGSVSAFGYFLLSVAVALLPVFAMAMSAQRASMGFISVYILALFALYIYKSPVRTVLIAVVMVLFTIPFYADIQALMELLVRKTSLSGFNMRGQEIAAVWDSVSGDIAHLVFGLGWGGTFESPAVGLVRVNFTHNLLSTFLLKMGVIGVLLITAYMAGVAQKLFTVIRANPVLGLALAGPFLIDVFLYASFKSLDFGMLLLLVITSAQMTKSSPGVAQSR